MKYGEEIYVAGFPGGMFKAMTKGVVSNPLRNFRGIKTNILSVRIMQGNSGGPFFAKRGNKYVWMGLVRAYILNGRGLNSELVMAVPSNEIISIADHTIRHADEIIKMVAEKKKTATEKKQNPVPGHPK